MNFAYFIAKRITFSKEIKKSISNSVLKIAVAAVAIGMAVMIITVSVVTGFKNEIYRKIIGFRSHITIKNRDMNSTFENQAILKNQIFYPNITNEEGIKHIQVYATKPAIIKTKSEIQGIILKGADTDFDWSFFKENLTEGEIIKISEKERSKKIVISRSLADLLELKIDDKLTVYFVRNPPRIRIFEVSGIFDTGMEEFDKIFAVCDIKHIQRLNNWNEKDNKLVGGFEIHIDNFDDLDEMTEKVREIAGSIIDEDGSMLEVSNYKENFPQIVDWLNLSDMNVVVILTLMIIVAILNMISGLLIIILERTNMIGILKAIGAENSKIRKIFILKGAYLIGKGLLWGNLIGISFLLIQKYFSVIPLNPKTYYVDTVPVNFDLLNLLFLNFGTFGITIFSLIFPAMMISKISPSKTIKFN